MSMNQYTFFGEHRVLESLTQHGDRLVELDRQIQWAPLVAVAEKVWRAGAEAKADGARELLEAFNRQLAERGLLVKEGVMVDATFVEVRANRRKSKTRARVEHHFAFREKSLGRIYHRCIGLVKNEYQIGLMNLCYKLCRCVQLITGRGRRAS